MTNMSKKEMIQTLLDKQVGITLFSRGHNREGYFGLLAGVGEDAIILKDVRSLYSFLSKPRSSLIIDIKSIATASEFNNQMIDF